MKYEMQLLNDITKLTSKIETDYPELYKYLEENPMTLPSGANPEMDEKTLQDYLESLKQLLEHHRKTHKMKPNG